MAGRYRKIKQVILMGLLVTFAGGFVKARAMGCSEAQVTGHDEAAAAAPGDSPSERPGAPGDLAALRQSSSEEAPLPRQYAPDREIDLIHLALDITPDFKQRTIIGTATLTFKPIARPLAELRLNAVDLSVKSVTSSEKLAAYQVGKEDLVLTFDKPLAPGQDAWVKVDYSAEPARGLYFRTPEMGYKPGDTHLFSQGEETEARYWYPCYDSPNMKFTSEVTCHVPEGMAVISNGKLVSEEKDPTTGLMAVHWAQEKPHSNYLITLAAGYLKKLEDHYHNLPLAWYTPASEINEAGSSFRDTGDMIGFYEQEIGVPYPWAKYYQVCVNDFMYGGMENTSATTLTDSILFTPETENIRDSQMVTSHELAHQWFGDLVTCKDWSQAWLNEGFATYYSNLYDEHKHGRASMLYHLYESARGILGRSDDTRPIVTQRYGAPDEQFSYLAYQKGSWVLHMLRSELGEDLYRRCIKTYLERHQYGNVVTSDLSSVVEELSGRSYDQFFDQWVYHGHYPELEATYNWDARARLARVSIRQVQKVSDEVLLFHFPLTIGFKLVSGTVEKTITVKDKSEDFYFPLADAPQVVRLDPHYTHLAKIHLDLPAEMTEAQLTNQEDVIGRLLAVEQLSARVNHRAVAKLREVLNSDPFYGVRIESARALRSIHSEEAWDALAASTVQPDARVRLQVYQGITGFYSEQAAAVEMESLAREKNPAILREIIQGLGAYGKAEVQPLLVRYLHSSSYRNSLADAAISAIHSQDDPVYIPELRRALQEGENQFTSSGLGRGLETLAYLARHETQKDTVRDFITQYVNSKKRRIQLAAIQALGTLGDARALASLQTFAGAARESPERQAAERAIAAIDASKQPSDELRDLRSEVLALQASNRDLQKEIEDVKKKLEARDTVGSPKG